MMATSSDKENADQRQPLLMSSSSPKGKLLSQESNGSGNTPRNYDSTSDTHSSNKGNENGSSSDHSNKGNESDKFDLAETERFTNVYHQKEIVTKENNNDEENDHTATMFDKKLSNITNVDEDCYENESHKHTKAATSKQNCFTNSNYDGDGDDRRKDFALLKNDRSSYTNIFTSFRNIIKKDAVHFGVRLSTLLTCASLFVLIHHPYDDEKGALGLWPQGGWVYITTLMVSWFPQGDAASIIEKSMQRCMGTVFGGFLGLSCGFISLELGLKDPYHSIFLGFCIALVTYGVGFTSCQVQLSRKSRFIDQYSYASCLCLMTFGIAIFPFIDSYTEAQWKKGCFRVINVFCGCIIGAVGSTIVLPKSTTNMLHEQIKKQCKLAGEASEAVLHASAEVFSGEMQPRGFMGELLLSMRGGNNQAPRLHSQLSFLKKTYARINKDIIEEDGDVALEKYEAAIGAWKVTKGLFSKFRFDPFHCRVPSKDKQIFRKKCASTLARALRIQTTVVLLDGIIRNDPRHDYFTDDVVTLFAEIGTLIRKMLTVPLQKERSKSAKDQLVEKIAVLRRGIIRLCSRVAEQPIGAGIELLDDEDTLFDDDDEDDNTTLSSNPAGGGALNLPYGGIHKRESASDSRRGSVVFDDSHVYSLLFLQLIEHLTLRCCSLYEAWIKVEEAAIPLHKSEAAAAASSDSFSLTKRTERVIESGRNLFIH